MHEVAVLGQHADAVAHVVSELVQPHAPPGLTLQALIERAAIPPRLLDVAEPLACLFPSRCGGHSLVDQLLGPHVEVKLHFGIEVRVDLVGRAPGEPKEATEWRHETLAD